MCKTLLKDVIISVIGILKDLDIRSCHAFLQCYKLHARFLREAVQPDGPLCCGHARWLLPVSHRLQAAAQQGKLGLFLYVALAQCYSWEAFVTNESVTTIFQNSIRK